jgi:hypothetical protein
MNKLEIIGKELADMEKRIHRFPTNICRAKSARAKQDKTYAPILQKANEAIKSCC